MVDVGWTRGNRMGRRVFGEVFIAKSNKLNLLLITVKSAPADEATSLVAEFDIFSKFCHVPGIIQCFGEGRFDVELAGETTYNLFLEYAAGGSLSGMLADYDRIGISDIPERDVKLCTLSLLEALSYVHSTGYSHCDIKPDNVLVFQIDDRRCELKIVDFGIPMESPDLDSPESRTLRGTMRHLPPEMIINGTAAMDIWVFGCLVVEMLTGERPLSTVVIWRIANGDGLGRKLM